MKDREEKLNLLAAKIRMGVSQCVDQAFKEVFGETPCLPSECDGQPKMTREGFGAKFRELFIDNPEESN